MSWSVSSSTASSINRIVQSGGHSAASVISPRGGMTTFSGSRSSIPENDQKELGILGQTSSAFILLPSGGNAWSVDCRVLGSEVILPAPAKGS